MINVLFTGKEHRVRRRETMLHPPDGITFIPQQSLDSMKRDHELSNSKSTSKIFNLLFYNNFIPKKDLKNIDIIYSPGKFILNKFPHVIEIDNVATLAYYNLTLLKVLKPFIKSKLKSKYCKKIICISEAAKKSVVNYFNDEIITNKCTVIYPYLDEKFFHVETKKEPSITRFLFISTDFYLKGGKELLNAFDNITNEYANCELTIITKTAKLSQEIKKKINQNKKINLVEANLDKEQLYNNFYSTHDVFIMPTYHDSLGLVFLEAINMNMPIIATNYFATPEFVLDHNNGFLIDPPFSVFKKDFTPDDKWWTVDKSEYAKNNSFPDIEGKLFDKMELFILYQELVPKFSEGSLVIKQLMFNEKDRRQKLKEALQCVE